MDWLQYPDPEMAPMGRSLTSSVLIKDALAGSYTIRIQTPFQLGTLSYPSKIQYELGYVLATSNTSSSNGTATN
ncbi:MAG: hypothetical protein ACKOB5_06435, partial [Betaproteobacteria bacterium]